MAESSVANVMAIINQYDKNAWTPKTPNAVRIDLYYSSANNTCRFIAYSGQQIILNAPLSKDAQYQKTPGWHSFQDLSKATYGLRFATPADGDQFGKVVTDTLTKMKSGGAAAPPPPKPPAAAPPAGGPPKAPPNPPVASPPTPAAAPPSGGDDEEGGDSRNALLASIRAGKSLKKVQPPPESNSLAGRVVGEGDKSGSSAPAAQASTPRAAPAAKPMDMGSELAMKLKQRSSVNLQAAVSAPVEKAATPTEIKKPAPASGGSMRSNPSAGSSSLSSSQISKASPASSGANASASASATADVAALREEFETLKKDLQQFIKSEMDAMKKEILAALKK